MSSLARVLLAVFAVASSAAPDSRAVPASSSIRSARAGGDAERIARDLRRLGYAVRDSVNAGADLVLVLGDVHDPAITGATLDGLDSLRTIFRYDAIGFENFDHDFRNLAARGSRSPLTVAFDSLLGRAGPELVQWADLRSRMRGPSAAPRMAGFLERHRSMAFGVERGDSAMLFLKAADAYVSLLTRGTPIRGDSATPADVQAWRDVRRRGIDSLGAFLAAADPACPRAPASFTRDSREMSEVGNLFVRLQDWFIRHALDERNRAIADNVRAELSRRGGTRAIVIVGMAHTLPNKEWPNLQRRLQESGLSVIVADPPAVRSWIERHPEVVRPVR